MRKPLTLILIMITIVILSACSNKEINELPDLTGLTIAEIEDLFEDSGIELSIELSGEDSIVNQQVFKNYANGLSVGDSVSKGDIVYIVLYAESVNLNDEYFDTIFIEYNGPLLDSSFFDISAVAESDGNNSNILHVATGGAFEASLKFCADGDTAIFYYPSDVYEAIIDTSKRARFLNMDTEETFTGGEEEWGKPASVYTCELLNSAEKIAIQTDPGDNLLGNYNRLLSWIWIKLPGETDYHLLNYMVVKQGLAQVKYEYGAGETISYGDHTYNEWMHIAEDYAISNNLGQWGDLLDYYWDYDNESPNWDLWNN